MEIQELLKKGWEITITSDSSKYADMEKTVISRIRKIYWSNNTWAKNSVYIRL